MIMIDKLNMKTIPALHLYQKEKQGVPLPLVIFLHGFTSSKEQNLHYAFLLAENGFRVVLPEATLHGERSKVKMTREELMVHFWDIVVNGIEELQVIKSFFEDRRLIENDKIGVAGTSMGAIIALGALTQYSWIQTAASLMGNPNFVQTAKHQINMVKNEWEELPLTESELHMMVEGLQKYDLSLQSEKLNGRPLFFWHGKKDHVVPFEPAYAFFNEIKTQYKNKELLRFIVDENAGHKVSIEGQKLMVKWFSDQFIGKLEQKLEI